jgi:hypothetical protein
MGSSTGGASSSVGKAAPWGATAGGGSGPRDLPPLPGDDDGGDSGDAVATATHSGGPGGAMSTGGTGGGGGGAGGQVLWASTIDAMPRSGRAGVSEGTSADVSDDFQDDAMRDIDESFFRCVYLGGGRLLLSFQACIVCAKRRDLS